MRFPRECLFPRFVGKKERNSQGTLLCICGKPQKFFSGKHMRGFCSEECVELLERMEKRNGKAC